MRWLIDGYNVIRLDPDLATREREGLEAGRIALLRVIARAARASGDRFTVVFDGARMSTATAGTPGALVEVLFSRPPEKADDVLMRLAARWGNGAVVVTSDRAVQTAAQRAGGAAVAAGAFLEALDSEDGDVEDAADGDRPRIPRGNPRRLSREARATRRALDRLRGRLTR